MTDREAEQELDRLGLRKAPRWTYHPFAVSAAFFALLGVVLALGLPGKLTSPDGAEELLADQGFTQIELADSSYVLVGLRGCGEADTALYRFEATNPTGERVDIDVCQGWPFKGATVRGQ